MLAVHIIDNLIRLPLVCETYMWSWIVIRHVVITVHLSNSSGQQMGIY